MYFEPKPGPQYVNNRVRDPKLKASPKPRTNASLCRVTTPLQSLIVIITMTFRG